MRALAFLAAAVLLAGCADEAAPPATSPKADAAWASLAQVAPARLEAGLAAADGRLWLVGGLFDADAAAARVDVYDPATDTWSAGPQPPVDVEPAATSRTYTPADVTTPTSRHPSPSPARMRR